jgi:RNA polymerase sigma-70 factor (ECF subfamily)
LKPDEQDILLWKQYQQGSEAAFGALFRRFYPPLVQFGSKLTLQTDLLEDSIQELFTELWQHKSQTDVQSVKAYLFKSLKYKLLRALARKQPVSATAPDAAYGFELSHESLLISDEENNEQASRVLKAFEQLSDRQKEIIYLKFYQELSYGEVGEIMNINYQASRNLLYQAIKSLKKMMVELILFWMVTRF